MDLRRVLYGLYAILRLHFAQEEEAYAWLASSDDDPGVHARLIRLRSAEPRAASIPSPTR